MDRQDDILCIPAIVNAPIEVTVPAGKAGVHDPGSKG
jgi:hypothetical protein